MEAVLDEHQAPNGPKVLPDPVMAGYNPIPHILDQEL
ncbi:hypothetical protein HDF08_002040 [Edaphobacter lichenicola]|uniref:Uncharacterized protein n=1 Tax=Tunturiibacter lichenicola TaxID=2051959 RepID=A0A852VAQ3_9BACT|nr:hypothetical protein [Edaphobacter lichenicola]